MPKKILVIEDDKDIRDTIMYALQGRNYEVIVAEDGKILKGIAELNPDLILLDNWLSDWKSDPNGQQLSKELKSSDTTRHIPIIMVSAVGNIKEVTEAGMADGYIKKPFELDELLTTVDRFLNK